MPSRSTAARFYIATAYLVFLNIALLWNVQTACGQSTWSSPSGGNWTDPTKWSNGVPNGPGAHAVIGVASPTSTSTMTLSEAIELSKLDVLTSRSVTFGGTGPLRFVNAPGTTAATMEIVSVFPLRVTAPTEIAANDLSINVLPLGNPGGLEFVGPLSGAGNITKLGAGTLTLSSNNSAYAGNISVQEGALIASSLAASTTTNGFSVSNGARLTITSAIRTNLINTPLVVDNASVDFRGTANNADTRMQGPIEVIGIATFSTSQIQSFALLDGDITGPGGLTIKTTSTLPNGLFFAISGDNSYDGVTVVDVGHYTTFRQVHVTSPTGLGSTQGNTIVRSYFQMERASQESFVVESSGLLVLGSDTVAHQGNVTLLSGIFQAYEAGKDEVTIMMSGNVEIQAGGQIGYEVMNPFDLTGNISGYGSLTLGGGGLQRYFGTISHDGDVIVDDRAEVELRGLVSSTGDLIVSKGNQGGSGLGRGVVWNASNAEFAGDVVLHDRPMKVSTNLSVENLTLDPRRPNSRASLLDTSVNIDPNVELEVRGELAFLGGGIRGQLVGVNEIHKTSIMDGSLAGLGENFSGSVFLHEGLLTIEDSGGVGSTAGDVRVVGSDRAVLVLNQGAVIAEDVFLNNASGFNFGGALGGGGVVSGNLHLGENGAYVGASNSIDSHIPDEFGGNLTIAGTIHGGTLHKSGHDQLIITSAGHTYDGPTDVMNGTLVLKDQANLSSTSEIIIRQTSLTLDDSGVHSNDRIDNDIPVSISGSSVINLIGNNSQHSSETIGQLNLKPGHLRAQVTPGQGTNQATLQINELNREAGATAHVLLGNTRARVKIGTDLPAGSLVPWAIMNEIGTFIPRDFAILGADGLVEYSSVQAYETNLNTAIGTSNVRLAANTTLTGDRNVNALRAGNASDLNLGGHQLTVESGGLLLTESFLSIHDGDLTSGTNELIVHSYFDPTIGANLIDNGDQSMMVTFAGRGITNLSGINTYSGGTVVSGGTLDIEGNRSLPSGGDLLVSNGTVRLTDSADGTWKIGTLRMQGNSITRLDEQSTGAIEAEEYLLAFGEIDVPITGAGTVLKTGEFAASLLRPNPNFTGQIVIEKGTLALGHDGSLGSGPLDEAHGTIVKPGGTLQVTRSYANELLILDGGDLSASPTSQIGKWSGPIEVRQNSRILSRLETTPYEVSGPIRGTGDLVVSGAFGDFLEEITISGSLNAFEGNLHVTGGSVRLNGQNANYAGEITVDATRFTVSNSAALGKSKVTILEAGRFVLPSNLTANLAVQGGLLAMSGPNTTLDGHMTFEGRSEIDSTAFDLTIADPGRSATIRAQTTFAEGARVKKIGRGNVLFTGTSHLAGNLELVAFDGKLNLGGTVVADGAATTVNLVGRSATFNASVSSPKGTSFQLLSNGQPMDLLVSNEASLSGGGTIQNNVVLGNGANISPGDSAGRLSINGDLQFGANNTYDWELTDIDGTAGSALGWDLIDVQGEVQFGATTDPLIIEIAETTALLNLDRDLRQAQLKTIQWHILESDGLIDFSFDDIEIHATRDNLAGRFSVTADGSNLYLVYAVPEPTAILFCMQLLCFVTMLRRPVYHNII